MKLILNCLVLFFTFQAQAEFFQGYGVEAGVELPVQIGVRAKLRMPNGFYSTVGVGYSPEFLWGVENSISSSVGITGEATGNIIEAALSNSFYVDIRGGWSADPGHQGWYFEGGYSLLTGGSGQTNMVDIENSVDQTYAITPEPSLTVESTLHSLTAHVGYLWEVNQQLILSVEAGIIKPISANTNLTFDTFVATVTSDVVKSELESTLNDTYKSEFFIPTASVWMSYLF